MADAGSPTARMAPLSLTMWGCGIILVWWGIVLGALAAAGWVVLTGAQWLLGG